MGQANLCMGHFSFLQVDWKFQWAILIKFNIAISVANGLLNGTMAPPYHCIKEKMAFPLFMVTNVQFYL